MNFKKIKLMTFLTIVSFYSGCNQLKAMGDGEENYENKSNKQAEQTTSNHDYLNNTLSQEILLDILKYLSKTNDVLSLRKVCKNFLAFSSDKDISMDRVVCRNDFHAEQLLSLKNMPACKEIVFNYSQPEIEDIKKLCNLSEYQGPFTKVSSISINLNKLDDLEQLLSLKGLPACKEIVFNYSQPGIEDIKKLCNLSEYQGPFAKVSSISINLKDLRDLIYLNKNEDDFLSISKNIKISIEQLKFHPLNIPRLLPFKGHFACKNILIEQIAPIEDFTTLEEIFTEISSISIRMAFPVVEKLKPLPYNNTGFESMIQFINILPKELPIKELDFSYSRGFEPRENNPYETAERNAVSFIEAVKNRKEITSINLQAIRDPYMLLDGLSEVLSQEGCSLENLDLSRNDITEECMKTLVKGLKKNTSLTSLDLSKTDVDYKSIDDIVDLLTNNKTLKKLYLKGNRFCSFSKGWLLEALNPAGYNRIIFE